MSGSGGSGLYTSQNPTPQLVEPRGYLKSVIDVVDITKKQWRPTEPQQREEDLRKISNLTFKSQVERSELINQLGGAAPAAVEQEKQPKKRKRKSALSSSKPTTTTTKKSKNTRW